MVKDNSRLFYLIHKKLKRLELITQRKTVPRRYNRLTKNWKKSPFRLAAGVTLCSQKFNTIYFLNSLLKLTELKMHLVLFDVVYNE